MIKMLNGLEIVTTNHITKTVQTRKHKKRRINKKWLKRYGYKEVPDNNKVFHYGNTLFMTQGCYQKLKESMSEQFKEMGCE